MRIKQFVPSEYCSKCDVCCRFIDDETPLAPCGLSLISYRDRFTQPFLPQQTLSLGRAGFICRNFDPAANRCKDYENRPLDCQLYPFVVMWDEGYRDIVLGIDPKCPYSKHVMPAKAGIHSFILDSRLRGNDNVDSKYILRFQDDIEILEKLNIKSELTLNKLLIGDRALFEKYASQNDRPVSSYSFSANYVWAGLLEYLWTIIDDNFCLFCKTKDTIFMPVPPLGKKLSKKAVKESFGLMNKYNKNRNCSRIEDVTHGNLEFFENLGYKIINKGCEYIYRRKDLTDLAGDRYKAKRALCNYFEKNYKFNIRKFESTDKEECLVLFRRWARERTRSHKEDYYKALVEDSYHAHKKAMERFQDLGLVGRIVVVDERIAAYTFGYRLDDEVFIILAEVADLKIKGLAQFIFREFSSLGTDTPIGKVPRQDGNARRDRSVPKLPKMVNVMDDSGLENLREVKMSYHPFRIEKTFCVYEPSPSHGGRLGKQEGLGE